MTGMTDPQSPRDAMQDAADELDSQANAAEILRETQGEYVETFTDPEKAGMRYYLDSEGVRVYLGPDELPPKKGDPNER